MIRGPQGPRMPCSFQSNREFGRAPTRIFVWRQSLRVGVRADGTNRKGKSEPLRSARGGPDRRRAPAAQRGRRREALPWTRSASARSPRPPRPIGRTRGARGAARVRTAIGGIAPGSLLINNPERAHNALVRDGGLEIEAHRANVNDPVYLERMEMVKDLCS